MKTYIVYVMGKEQGYIKAANLIAAEKKAQKKFQNKRITASPYDIQCVYTEI